MRQTKEINMDANMDKESMKQIAEAFGNVLGSIFGDNAPVVMVECKPADEENDATKHLLDVLKQHLADLDEEQEKDDGAADYQEAAAENTADGKHPISFEGDGEEVFTEMMGDLITLADMVERLELILMAVSCKKMCPVRAMKAAGLMVGEVSQVMKKWLEYSKPEA